MYASSAVTCAFAKRGQDGHLMPMSVKLYGVFPSRSTAWTSGLTARTSGLTARTSGLTARTSGLTARTSGLTDRDPKAIAWLDYDHHGRNANWT
jgi:hypothetical protein